MKIRQLAQCGNTMFAVGSFTSILRYKSTYARNNVFSFDASTGTVNGWNPDVNGVVNSIALSADCTTAYLGGKFSSVHGTAAQNLAAISTTTGAVNTAFAHAAAGQVEAVLLTGRHILVGGYFTAINNSPKKYLASLDASTGRDDGYINVNLSGNYVYTDDGGRAAAPNTTRIYNFELSPDGSRLLVMGDFTSAAGAGRRQIFMLDLGATAATLDPWYSSDFDANCAVSEPFYLQAAAWSPDGMTVYVTTTGYKPAHGAGYRTSDPRAGLCDAAAAYPSTPGVVSRSWINYTGCDSLFSVATDANDVYIGGHERYANNPLRCDGPGIGAVSRPGLAALAPSNGLATAWDPTRARGLGADDMIVTGGGLWIASDNFQGSNACGGVANLSGICFLPTT